MGDSETEKIKAIIGNLLRKVDNDPSVKSVISAFDPFASKSSNCKSLNCPKYSVEILEKCAVFLGIKLADKDNFKLYTKPSLSTQLVLSLMALLPANCGECSQDYVIDHEPDVEPFFRCHKCYQGAHGCEINRKLHEAIAPMLHSTHLAVLFGYVRLVMIRLSLLNLAKTARDIHLNRSHRVLSGIRLHPRHLLPSMKVDFSLLQGWHAAIFFNGNVPTESEGTNLLGANVAHSTTHECVSSSDGVVQRAVL